MMEVEEGHSHGDTATPVDQETTPAFGCGSVSPVFKCETRHACRLHIYDIASKLKHSGLYHIGGTYSNGDPEFWFYCTTSCSFGSSYLLNLFVCHRKSGHFSIGVSDSNNMSQKIVYNSVANESVLSNNLAWYSFQTAELNEKEYIKTYCFSSDNIKSIGNNTLVIPVNIKMNPKFSLNQDFVKSIKLQHDLVGLILKQEKPDFTLVSKSSKKYSAHKILLAAQSDTFRLMIARSKTNEQIVDLNDDEIEILLEFINSGTLKDVAKYDSFVLLDIAERFQVQQLFFLVERILCPQVNVDNAIKIAIIAKKFKLNTLQQEVYNYISNNPQVLKTEDWKTLNDVELTKDLFQIHVTNS